MRATLITLAAAVALAGCATTNRTADVTRFHLGQNIPVGAISVVPVDGAASFSLEYRSYADAVAHELAGIGFLPVGNNMQAVYVATLTVDTVLAPGPVKHSGLTIGIGGGSFGRGGGFGGGVSFPVGDKRHRNDIRQNTLGIQIRSRLNNSVVWEGKATSVVPDDATDASLAANVPKLAHALLAGFPGPQGQTIRVPVK